MMRRRRSAQRVFCLVVSAVLALVPQLGAIACGPDFPVAVMSNQTHPDLPLRLFAAGNLGVVQPAWARSYLCVAYRYLSGLPLDTKEQDSIVRLWHKRLSNEIGFSDGYVDVVSDYLKVRAKALGANDKKVPDLYSKMDSYSYQQNIGTSAVALATRTLNERIKRYGAGSAAVREWVKGQDVVFGLTTSEKPAIPPMVGGSVDALIREDRSYQIAAATLYAKEFAKAAQLFASIASNKSSPWSKLAPYLVARCKANNVLAGANEDVYEDAVSYIKSLISSTTSASERDDLQDLLCPVLYTHMDPPQLLGYLVKSVTTAHATRFGGDVGDLSYTVSEIFAGENSDTQTDEDKNKGKANTDDLEKYDLTDWLLTTSRRDDDWYVDPDSEGGKLLTAQRKRFDQRAVEKWRATRSFPWLVAAMSLNGLQSTELNDVFEAAQNVPEQSPAYLTASFFVIDALIARKNVAAARERINKILARTDLAPSARNLFLAQRLSVSQSANEFLHSAAMNPPVVSSNNFFLPDNWMKIEQLKSFYSEPATFDAPVAADLNRNLPLSGWMKAARDATLPPYLHGRIVRSTWLRAHILNRPDLARALSREFAKAYPVLGAQIRQCDAATSSEQRKFEVACMVLRTFGLTPYVEGGVERHGDKINEFDYYNANFWVPMPLTARKPSAPGDVDFEYTYPSVVLPGTNKLLLMMQTYYSPGIRPLLTDVDRKASDAETKSMLSASPAQFLGAAVFAWARTHPQDPRVPEMLYRVVKIPKWSASSAIGSQYSRDAYRLLHSRYKNSPWAKKATVWY